MGTRPAPRPPLGPGLRPALLLAGAAGLLVAGASAATPDAAPGATSATGAAAAGSAPHRVPDTLTQRLQPCMACHGAEGRASREGYLPRIAGKPAGYLYQQLLNFRDGRRSNATMAGFLAHQSDAYLHEMAVHFAGLDLPHAPPPPVPASPALLARGERLVRQGDPARRLPACTACHGAALAGAQPTVPGLLGLPRDYLIAQLGAWQTGTRRAVAPDCMAEVARRLAPEDVGALATWLAAQAVPAGARPDPAPVRPAPLPCGALQTPATVPTALPVTTAAASSPGSDPPSPAPGPADGARRNAATAGPSAGARSGAAR